MLFFPAKKASAGRWNNIMVLQKWKASAGNGRMEKNNGGIWGRALDGDNKRVKGELNKKMPQLSENGGKKNYRKN